MVICKFYLQGRCSYGERCRFEHSTSSSRDDDYHQSSGHLDNKNRFSALSDYETTRGRGGGGHDAGYQSSGSYNNKYVRDHRPQQESQRSGRYGYEDQSRGQDYHQQTYCDDYDGDDIYSDPQSQQTYDAYANRGAGGGGGGGQRGDSSQTYNKGGADKYRYRAVAADRTASSPVQPGSVWQHHDQAHYQPDQQHQDQQKDRFTPQSTEGNDDFNVDEAVAVIAEDMASWPISGMWPFSCFAFTKETQSFPELDDISFEEARLSAYTAKDTGQMSNYISSVGLMLSEYKRKRDELSHLNRLSRYDLLELFRRLRDTTHIQVAAPTLLQAPPTSAAAGGFSFTSGHNPLAAAATAPQATAAAAAAAGGFSFLAALNATGRSESNSMSQSGSGLVSATAGASSCGGGVAVFGGTVSSSSFPASVRGPVIPLETGSAIHGGGGSAESSLLPFYPVYTPLTDLTPAETTQYQAAEFTLGLLPLRPPPREYCFS